MVKVEFKKLFRRKELYIVITICIVIAIVGFFEKSYFELNRSLRVLNSAAQTAMVFDSITGIMYLIMILPILSIIPFSDIHTCEKLNKTTDILLTRTTKFKYYMSKYLVIAVIGFAVAILPLILNQIFTLLAFSIETSRYFVSGDLYFSHMPSLLVDLEATYFPHLYMNSLYLLNLVHILMAGIYGMVCAISAYIFTLFVIKNRFIAIIIPSAFWLALAFVFEKIDLRNFVPGQSLIAGPLYGSRTMDVGIWGYIIVMSAFLLLGLAAMYYVMHRKRGQRL